MTKNKTIYISPNGKWGIQSLIADDSMSSVLVVDRKTLKRHHVSVEHIKAGQKLLLGGRAQKTEDHFIGAELIPSYVRREILAKIKERV